MTRALRNGLALLAGVLALMAIQRTMPDYATLRGPILRPVAAGQTGHGLGYSARLEALTVAPNLIAQDYSGPVTRTTGGIWLAVRVTLAADGPQPAAALPAWHSASGRVYQPTRRAGVVPGALRAPPAVQGQPAAEAVAIFELPAIAEVMGGTLALGSEAVRSFDAELRMQTTGVQPAQTVTLDAATGRPV